MPRTRIGERQVAGDVAKEERRIFNNGHKAFTAADALVLQDSQRRERKAAETFERSKSSLLRPRNPITGDPTPRREVDLRGEVTRQTGALLFPSDRPAAPTPRASQSTSSVVKYRVGGNDRSYKEEGNPLQRTDLTVERIASLQNLQDQMGGEIEYLREVVRQKEQQMHTMSMHTTSSSSSSWPF